MVPGRLCISVSILSDTESSVCIRCLIPLQRYLISLMLSSRTEQRRQSECKKTTTSTYRQHPFQGRKTDVEEKIEIKGNTMVDQKKIFLSNIASKPCQEQFGAAEKGLKSTLEIGMDFMTQISTIERKYSRCIPIEFWYQLAA